MYNIDNIIEKIKRTVDSHKLENDGEYCRYIWQDENNTRKMGLNEYGCADAANILYTINDFIKDPKERDGWIRTLKSFQNSKTGLFCEPTHHFIHTTAHCVAALELFDAVPDYPLYELIKYAKKDGLYNLLENLKWKTEPWPQSHQGAGIYASMKLTDTVGEDWEKWYFDWLWEEADAETGMWRKGCVKEGEAPLFHHMGGTFHYVFNHEYAKKPLRYPDKLIDTCIYLYENKMIGDKIGACDNDKFGQYIGFLEVDWIYCITRASRQTTHRHDDCKRVLRDFAKTYINYLNDIDEKTHDGFNDLHMLFGATCALAELQTALPGEIISKKPLRLVLDRRPFI